MESDSRRPRTVKNIEGLLERVSELFGFDPAGMRDRILYCVLQVSNLHQNLRWIEPTVDRQSIDLYLYESIDRVYHNVNGILNLLFIYGYEFYPQDLGRLWNKLLWLDLGNEMEEYLKFQSSSYLAKMLKQDIYAGMPQSAKFAPEFFLSGRMNKFLRKKLFTRDLHFGWSVCQLKRGMSPLRGISVIENLRKHARLLSNQRLTPTELLREVTRTTREVCEVASPEFKVQRPSPAACYENTRLEQGCIRTICSKTDHDDPDNVAYSFGLLSFPHTEIEIIDGVETEIRCQRINQDLYNTLSQQELNDIYWSNDEILFEEFYRDPELEVFAETDSRKAFTELENRVHDHEGPVPATVVALSEPFKTRIITKSMADSNYYAKPLQQAMHSALRKNNIFTALDRPLVLEDFVDMCNIKSDNPDWCFVSGDYSAATDNLNSDATLTSLYQVMESMQIQMRTRVVLAKAVANQEINYVGALNNYVRSADIQLLANHCTPILGYYTGYEKNFVKLVLDQFYCPQTFVQTNGQLMGSILSFPLLCMINAAVFRHAAEIYHEEVTGERINLLMSECSERYGLRVNGDDILFVAPLRLIEIWSELVATIGLELSVGKNYVHPSVFTINSQMFEVKKNLLVEHNYVNLGLFNIEQTDYSFWRTCDRVQQRLLKGHYGERAERIHEVMMYNWSPTLIRLSKTLKCTPNWYFPRHLGGLGLQTFEPVKATEFQCRVATALMTRNTIEDILRNKFTYSERVVDPVLEHQLGRWKKIVKSIGYELSESLEEKEDDLLGSLMSRYTLDYIVYDVEAKERSLMREMTRTWKKYDRLCGGLKPASIEKILFDLPKSIKLRPYQFDLTEYTTSYPRCEYDVIDANTDEFPMKCDRNPEILDLGFEDFWSSMGYQRIPETGALAHH